MTGRPRRLWSETNSPDVVASVKSGAIVPARRIAFVPSACLLMSASDRMRALLAARCTLDQVRNDLGLGNINGVAALHFDDGRAGAFGHGAFEHGRNDEVLVGNHIPAGFGLPCRGGDGGLSLIHISEPTRLLSIS